MTDINQTLDLRVLNWLDGARDEYLTCRDLKHDWPRRRPKWVRTWDNRLGRTVYMRFIQCGGCGYTKTERMDPDTFEMYRPVTEYPKDDDGKVGYLLPPGVGRLKRADVLQYEILSQNGGVRDVKQPPGRRTRKRKK